MENISIFLYSYRNKKLYSIIENIVNSCSDENNFILKVVDQNNVYRGEITSLSNKRIKIIYDYIPWDSIDSPILYKQNFLNGIVSKYHLQISDRVLLPNNWDKYFISLCKDNIISGSGYREYEIKNKFMLKKKNTLTDTEVKCRIIDRNLIFTKTNILKSIRFPINLKYYGEEEMMSFIARIQNIDIISIPSHAVSFEGLELEERDYVPFSLYHNYNDIIKFYKENDSKLQEFGKMSEIYPLPFMSNDVHYDIRRSKIDQVGGERYLGNTMMVD